MEEHAPMQLSEVIFVDNPTTDESPDIVDQLAEEKIWHKVIHLSRNFGQHPATIAGILHSSGDWVFTIDDDVHIPWNLEEFLRQAVVTGSDLIYARDSGPLRLYKSLLMDS